MIRLLASGEMNATVGLFEIGPQVDFCFL